MFARKMNFSTTQDIRKDVASGHDLVDPNHTLAKPLQHIENKAMMNGDSQISGFFPEQRILEADEAPTFIQVYTYVENTTISERAKTIIGTFIIFTGMVAAGIGLAVVLVETEKYLPNNPLELLGLLW